MSSVSSQNKRLILSASFKLLALGGLVLFSLPFFAGLFQTADDDREEEDYYMLYDVSGLERGELKKIKQFSAEVWVYYRTRDDISQITTMPQEMFRDPFSKDSSQPADALPGFRSLTEDYFVFIPFETRRQCQVQMDQLPAGQHGFSEACYRGYFDTAGRVLAAYGHEAQKNLAIPAYRWRDASTLLLDRRQ